MNILSWNCRGLGNLRTVQELRRLVKEKKPKIVFLMETKARAKRMEIVRSQLGFEHMLVVDSVGKSGGLALLWMSESGVEIQNYSRRHINATVCSSPMNTTWKFTGFYGHPDASKRMEAWNLLRFIARMEPSPWLCLGDFNEILSLDEKYGGSGRQRGLMENFQRTLDDCGLLELGYRGPKFTWNNGKEGTEFIKERLDRVVAKKGWCEAFPEVEVVIGPAICSDHSPLSVFLLGQSEGKLRRPRNFKYEAGWELHNRCRQIIENSWKGTDNDPWKKLLHNMEGCKMALTRWQRIEVGKPNRVFVEQCHKLASLQGDENDYDGGQALGVQRDLQVHLEQEELKWRQRAKINWLSHGDKNSKFFHACANQRRKVNNISKIKDEGGRLWESQEEVGKVFVNYYQSLFLTGGEVDYEDCLGALEGRITETMNESLVRPFVEEEVRTALFQMAPLKAPGPDGFNAGFFQKHWDIVGTEVCNAILFSLNNAVIDKALNSTYIALIPKVKNPTSVTDFRPISLCNVMYKIISKVLANRLKISVTPHHLPISECLYSWAVDLRQHFGYL
jgi:exonuclease III